MLCTELCWSGLENRERTEVHRIVLQVPPLHSRNVVVCPVVTAHCSVRRIYLSNCHGQVESECTYMQCALHNFLQNASKLSIHYTRTLQTAMIEPGAFLPLLLGV
jgi:hypothetical protein